MIAFYVFVESYNGRIKIDDIGGYKMNIEQSQLQYEIANEHIVGGVNSPSRSFKGVGGGIPVSIKKGNGAYLYDLDDNRYIDYIAAYGPIITGTHTLTLQKQLHKLLKMVSYMEHQHG